MTKGHENQYIPIDVNKFNKRFTIDTTANDTLESKELRLYKTVCKGKPLDKLNAAAVYRQKSEKNEVTVFLAGSTRIDVQNIWEREFRQYETTDPKSYTRFKNFARCVSYRNDGSLVCGGEDGGYLHIFHAETKSQLRRIKCHQGPVSACAFSNNQLTYVATGGEDKALRIWDITDGQCKFEVPNAHEDKITFIRAEPFYDRGRQRMIFATCSLDSLVKVWEFDASSNEKSAHKCLFSMDHEDPVASVDFFPSCMLLVSGGGSNIKVWDISSQGTMLHCIESHVKNITSLCVSNDSNHIVTAGYDRMVKIHNSSKFKIIHSIQCDDVIISVNYWVDSSNKSLVFIGLGNGQWILKEYVPPELEQSFIESKRINKIESRAEKIQKSFFRRAPKLDLESAEILVDDFKPRHLAAVDRYIHEFKYKLALSKAVQMKDTTGLAVIDSFIDKGVISLAVSGQNEETIIPLLNFIHREFGQNVLSTPLLIEFLYAIIGKNTLLGLICTTEENDWLYDTHDLKVSHALQKISAKIEDDVRSHQLLQELYGILVCHYFWKNFCRKVYN